VTEIVDDTGGRDRDPGKQRQSDGERNGQTDGQKQKELTTV